MGNFINWLEYGVVGRTVTNPKRTAEKWWHNIPHTKFIDEGLVDRLAKAASNTQLNARIYAARMFQTGRPTRARIFKQDIDGTVIKNVPDERKKGVLGEINIEIQTNHVPQFMFGIINELSVNFGFCICIK